MVIWLFFSMLSLNRICNLERYCDKPAKFSSFSGFNILRLHSYFHPLEFLDSSLSSIFNKNFRLRNLIEDDSSERSFKLKFILNSSFFRFSVPKNIFLKKIQ